LHGMFLTGDKSGAAVNYCQHGDREKVLPAVANVI
jgi:hypothetical protein